MPENAAIPTMNHLNYEKIKDIIVWRCISMRFFSGGMSGFAHTEYVYDDYVLTTGISNYLEEITQRGDVNKMTLHRVGPFSQVLGSEKKQHPGTVSIAKQKTISKLENFGFIIERKLPFKMVHK